MKITVTRDADRDVETITYDDGGLMEKLLEEMRCLQKDFQNLKESVMSQISDYKAAVDAAFADISTSVDGLTTSVGGLTSDIAQLNDTITKLQNTPPVLTAQDQALLDASQAQAVALAAKTKTVADALAALDAQTTPPAVAPLPANDAGLGSGRPLV